MQNVPLAPLGRPVTGKRFGHVMEHHKCAAWRRKYKSLQAYLKANPGPVGRLVSAPAAWVEHYRTWLTAVRDYPAEHRVASLPVTERRAWAERVLQTLPVPA